MRAVVLAALALVAAACASDLPTPTVSKHIQTLTGTFDVDPATGEARCAMTYKVREPFSKPLDLRVEFESPVEGGAPFVIERPLEPGDTEVTVRSPDYPSLRNDHDYRVVLRGYSQTQPPQLWFEHRDTVRLTLSSEAFEQFERAAR